MVMLVVLLVDIITKSEIMAFSACYHFRRKFLLHLRLHLVLHEEQDERQDECHDCKELQRHDHLLSELFNLIGHHGSVSDFDYFHYKVKTILQK